MSVKRIFSIIGLSVLLGLTVQTKSAHALYSPRLSQQVAIIRGHMESSQMENGHVSVLEEVEYFKKYDNDEAAAGSETGISGDTRVARELVFNSTYTFLLQNPFDSLLMVFGYNANRGEWISSCLRDEIWSMEALRDAVGKEMIKAYMLRDVVHGNLLLEDYKYLVTQLDLLRSYGAQPGATIHAKTQDGTPLDVTSNEYFFGTKPTGDNAINYYVDVDPQTSDTLGCPNGEFTKAFEQVGRSWKTFKTLASGEGANWDWGSIWNIAQANARIRAQQWIKANQIGLTLGGETGSRVQSLVKGGGWDKFVGSVKTQLRILENMVGPVTPLWEAASWVGRQSLEAAGIIDECNYYYQPDTLENGSLSSGGVFRNCTDQQYKDYLKCKNDPEAAQIDEIRCDRFRNTKEINSISGKLNTQLQLQEERKQTLEEARSSFKYSISLDSVAENGIYDMDAIIWDMNMNIRRGYEDFGKVAGEGIPSITYKVAQFSNKQCVNKK